MGYLNATKLDTNMLSDFRQFWHLIRSYVGTFSKQEWTKQKSLEFPRIISSINYVVLIADQRCVGFSQSSAFTSAMHFAFLLY